MNLPIIKEVNDEIPQSEIIAQLTSFNEQLINTIAAASLAYTAQKLESTRAAKVSLDTSNLMMTDLRVKFKSALAAQIFASEQAALIVQQEMAVERNAFKQAALAASYASTALLLNLKEKYEAAATSAADSQNSSLIAQRLASQLATEEAKVEANCRLEMKRDESTQAALVASKASALLLMELQEKYEAAATAAADASESSMSAQRLASQLAIEDAEVVANSRVANERIASKEAAIIASKASDSKFLDQKYRFEAMAAAAADASDSYLVAERIASQLATELAELEAKSRIAVVWNESKQAALIASEASATKFLDQRLMYEAAASAAADASDSSLIAQRFASQLATEEAEVEANCRIEMKRDESTQAALVASKASALLLKELREKYMTAATAAADASESSMTAQRLASQQAREEAAILAEFRMTTERNASKRAAIMASEASNTKFLDQKSRYEIAAVAAADASQTKMAAELSIFERATKLASEAYALKLTDNTKITERLKLQAEFAVMESEQLRNISANVAHDLKSPLQTLLIGLESMRCSSASSSQPENSEMLDMLNSACAFMTSSISRTIEFSKTSTGVSLIPSNSSFSLVQALNNPIKWMQSMLPPEKKMGILLMNYPSDITMIVSDKHWVEENLLCLLSNAVKYSNKGMIYVTVKLEKIDETDHVRVAVEDTGIGISSESKLLLFKQFSVVQNMTVGSTGLGLYSLSKRVDAMQGHCGVTDRKDGKEGSNFWFTFPYRPEIMEECEKESLTDSENTATNTNTNTNTVPFQSLNILIVDDSCSVVKILSNKLKSAGHRIVTACNGASGLDKMVEMAGKLDLVLMDIQMPVMDGIEATKRYREMEHLQGIGCHLPIICSSANSGGEAEDLALAAGVDSFLPKPFTTALLLTTVESVCK